MIFAAAMSERRRRTTGRTLSDLVGGLDGMRVLRGGHLPVRRVQLDSRKITPGDVFVALRGQHADGVAYLEDARERGASAVVVASGVAAPDRTDLGWVEADEPRLAVAMLAARAWGHPADRLPVIGVTGTNGKTTTVYLLRSIGSVAGRKPAMIGTLGTSLPAGVSPQARTTPEAPDLQAALSDAVEQGASMAALEVSSHALDLRRVDGMSFAGAAFLNLSPEHLDWHGDMDAYGRSKARLFRELLAPGSGPGGPRAVINANDPWADRIRDGVEEVLLFSTGGGDGDVTAHGVRSTGSGSAFCLTTPAGSADTRIGLPGLHNIENALAAAALAHGMGISLADTVRGLEQAELPSGRFERVHTGRFDAFVDYAHTPDGLRLALEVARRIARGRVLVVLGCGGDRDSSKRPVMGELASTLADVAIFTADNPRNEDPDEIIAQMMGEGCRRERVEVVPDREEALLRAVTLADEGDVVLAVGKGHETVQSVAGIDHPFPEREILAAAAASVDKPQ
ncbi:MAG: UDP-N-acetylmuramoyl-L-alanyl-D-glutamate--2,6-diaminopimelate ligase [Gemmatimonadota bacterium]|jgi:UDP-N-acetylmuramoyl-L-alanyl-D-glutamate--2,6-diaminopimelate ligase|nr:UDP-N-acetylmuramoyl-L-alanyl-D-glutamate--2,6-diaminopimelate ligase [Gemmatimonadota bacterium]MDP6529507.1 UDP-N-acetylmuramoyl-L-alanyl-D-glutamate--2,6-diaminopimelate ligase [Gemmatimonadota bacterium]MDP6802350.1 UDP-N-acetylmuramoyl-L-alanyl-D-glutamate--2,6-diaminopimelate ligase [Gemmatimonadota bacterium]MDP7032470.1 UDP-N-acetylmuramoyl-L-alanyl-D-glutamate--2,6-diaminopimelate ligase [Gemmatimonadota bacterium]